MILYMNYRIQQRVLLFIALVIAIYSVPVFGFNTYLYSVDEPEMTINSKETLSAIQVKESTLSRLAMEIQSGAAVDLAEFAKVCLSEMAYLYEEQAIKARHEQTSSMMRRLKLYRWSNTTLEYANYLYDVAESIKEETPVELQIGHTGELQFIINGSLLIISNPLIREPDILDQRIINTICQYKNCRLEYPELQQEQKKREIVIEAGWRFQDKSQPEYITRDGLHFIFDDIKNRLRKQNACLNIIKELKLMVDVLREANDKGIYVDWSYLYITSDTDNSDTRLVINDSGDSIIIELNELAKQSDLTEAAMSWIKAQTENVSYTQYLYADAFVTSVIH